MKSRSRRDWLKLAGMSSVVAHPLICAAEEKTSASMGEETSFEHSGLKNPLKLWIPKGAMPTAGWPVIFHFHGTGGNPTTDIPQRYTNGEEFVVIGMEYITRDLPVTTADYLDREWNNLLSVRTVVANKTKLDIGRTYVSGFSQGGWFASEFMEVYGKELAGAIVLGAGKRPRKVRQTKPMTLPKPVYLGAGQIDPNLPHTLMGLPHFKKLGAHVTVDSWLGWGHHIPMGGDRTPLAQSLSQWLKVEAMRPKPATLKLAAETWMNGAIEKAETTSEPLLRWLALTRLPRFPYHHFLPPTVASQLAGKISQMEKDPALKPELVARSAWFAAVEGEQKAWEPAKLWESLRRAAFTYAKVWKEHAHTHYGQCAAMDLRRLIAQFDTIDNWRFSNQTEKESVLAEALKNPLPKVEGYDDLAKTMKERQRRLDAQQA